MNFKPNPLLYGANEDFFSTFRLAIRMNSPVDYELLARSVEKAMVRYPYFCVYPEREGETLVLRYNKRPLPVFPDDRTVTLGSEDSRGHLISFGCKDKTIFIDASHYLADGMGVDPLLKSLLYIYVSERYGTEGLEVERIRMPDSPVCEGEFAYPFPDRMIEAEELDILPKAPEEAYSLDPDAFDKDGLYAYHLHIPQKAMMAKASSSDGSPVSFISVLLYRALHRLDQNIDKPVVAHVQHQYRSTLQTPMSHHSLVNYIPVVLSPRMSGWDVEKQNTVVRGQVILKGGRDADVVAIRHLIEAFPVDATLADKKEAMARYAEGSIHGKTFGISYVGKMDWCGLERYVNDLHAYIGEKHTENMLLIEIMTVGEDFSLTFMQSGRGEKYLNAFLQEIRALDIPVSLVGEEKYALCNTCLPE
ncbi:MAG: hypothetical protein IIW82_00805 [Clostridia bacterium]|nr:hypothetical protein [Clostridia bacterium]